MNLNLLVLKTHRLDELLKFYTAIGFRFSMERHGNGPTHYAAELGGAVFELYPLPEEVGQADRTTRLGFTVPDLDAALRALESAGFVQGTTPPGNRAVLRDPDGRAVELVAVQAAPQRA